MNPKVRIALLLILLLGIWGRSLPVNADVASPPLFDAQISRNPAAAALRETSNIAFHISQIKGDTKTETSSYDPKETEDIEADQRALTLVVISDAWVFEAWSDLNNTTTINNSNDSGSSVATSGNDYEIEVKKRSFSAGYRYDDSITLGAYYESWEEKNEKFSITNEEKRYGAGATYRFLETMRAGIGGNLVGNKQTGKVDNNWVEYYVGLSFTSELGTDSTLSLEWNTVNSPEDRKKASGSDAANYHQETTIENISAAVGLRNFKLMVQSIKTTIKALSSDSSVQDDTTQTSQIGLSFAPENAPFFVEYLLVTTVRERGSYTTTDSKGWELNLGIFF